MKVQSINNNYQEKINTRKKPNFKGYINDKLIKNAIANTSEHFNKIDISGLHEQRLINRFYQSTTTINEKLKALHLNTRLETFNIGLGRHTAILINDSSNYVEPLNFHFYNYFDDPTRRFHKNLGYKEINESPETNIEILSDLAKCLEDLDGLKVDATMALYTKEPSFRDEILKKWEDRYLKSDELSKSEFVGQSEG